MEGRLWCVFVRVYVLQNAKEKCTYVCIDADARLQRIVVMVVMSMRMFVRVYVLGNAHNKVYACTYTCWCEAANNRVEGDVYV